jgi:hypothetical protein
MFLPLYLVFLLHLYSFNLFISFRDIYVTILRIIIIIIIILVVVFLDFMGK